MHHHKLGASYYIACVPQDYASKLESILVSLLFSKCKVHGNMNLFRSVIQNLIYLKKDGLIVETIVTQKRNEFILVCVSC